MKKTLGLVFSVAFMAGSLYGQIFNPVRWEATPEKQTIVGDEEIAVLFTAYIDEGWAIYSLHTSGGPIPTSFTFENSAEYAISSETEEVTKPKIAYDASFQIDVGKYTRSAIFRRRFKALTDKSFTIKGVVEYMCCNDNSCLPPHQTDLSVRIIPAEVKKRADKEEKENGLEEKENGFHAETNPATETNPAAGHNNSLWTFILLALTAGFLGVLTPCVYPVIPLTVSFFLRNEKRSDGMAKALIFGLSVFLIYTSIGVIAALTKSADFTNQIVGHWLTNLIFAGIFIVFALWFFGLFEITLSGSLAGKIDGKAAKGGYFSTFFMALALVVVSFSCTGPFIGTVLVASAQGLAVKPILGMAAFGLAFALPFTLLAFFPSLLKKMPKSGSWMNSVKVVFAFIMLAFAVYFFAAVDRILGWGWVTRNGFLCIWTVLSAMTGFYLLGKIRLPHDGEPKPTGVVRMLFSVVAFSFALYLFTGILGQPLHSVSALLPETHHAPAQNVAAPVTSPATLCNTPKYSDRFDFPLGLKGYFDYDEAIACAKERQKPVLMFFKGHGCSKCREMEANIWPEAEILRLLNDKFILLALYTDDNTPLPETEHYVSAFDGKVKKTVGQKNTDIEITRFQTNAFPFYAILDAAGELVGKTMGYTSDAEIFKNFLKQ
ncbi:MAG: thioredoxin family protein [Bacteroidales bacterium]|jgi:thiol:disulfide interchange protein DsbD|nr:thioredoxin family protein [Bacteroidales bacterium]